MNAFNEHLHTDTYMHGTPVQPMHFVIYVWLGLLYRIEDGIIIIIIIVIIIFIIITIIIICM